MFGYCHSPECKYDLWSPTVHRDVENRAFSAYAKHTQEIEDIIQQVLLAAENGESDLTIAVDDCFSDEDIKYIEEEVYRRMRQ